MLDLLNHLRRYNNHVLLTHSTAYSVTFSSVATKHPEFFGTVSIMIMCRIITSI